MTAPFCEMCGRAAGADPERADPERAEHLGCARRRELEPPRYCAQCARRMVVQVTPSGWSAQCSVHGVTGRDPELV